MLTIIYPKTNDMKKHQETNNQQNPNTNSGDKKNGGQDLAAENIGFEPEETENGDPDSPYKLKHTLDDKRPEDSSIKKGWAVDSNTSRGPQDYQSDDSQKEPGDN